MTSENADAALSTAERLGAVWSHLGLATAHVATQMPADIAGMAVAQPDRLAGVVLCVPTRLDPAPFAAVEDRVLMIAGENDLTSEATARAATRLARAQRSVLAGYEGLTWADVVADRGAELTEMMIGFLDRLAASGKPAGVPRNVAPQGTIAGITYTIEGTGPALVLLPFFLAPSQWEPAIPTLRERFTVVTLGGAHLGGVAALEDRARAPTYQALFRTLIDMLGPEPGDRILDVGCGAGSLDRLLARRRGIASPITAMDTNPFLLRAAAALADADGLAGAIRFVEGNAENLPFEDASFDRTFSITVLEECDADRALAEMVRVTKPGGRIGVIVRSIDLPQWWSLDVPMEIRAKANTPPQSVGRKGIADASLYPRMRAAGLGDLVCFPYLVTLDRPDGPIWRYREDHVLSLLTPAETRTWQDAATAARAQGLLFGSHPMHCAVGTRPRSD